MNTFSYTTKQTTSIVNPHEDGAAPTINSVVSATATDIQQSIQVVANDPTVTVDPDVQNLAARLGTTAEMVANESYASRQNGGGTKRLWSYSSNDEETSHTAAHTESVAATEHQQMFIWHEGYGEWLSYEEYTIMLHNDGEMSRKKRCMPQEYNVEYNVEFEESYFS